MRIGGCGVALVLLATLGMPGALRAQEDAERLNTVTVSIGRSRDVDEGVEEIVRAIGADYLRKIASRWEVGVQLDVDFNDGADAVLVTPVVAFSITERWPVFAGIGVEFAHDHQQGFGRVGTEYVFPLGKRSPWFLAPGTFLDIGDDVTPSVMVALGLSF